MIRTIVHIDQEACDGCGLCVAACHEGAIGLVDGKARLLRDDYCDGMGDCLPSCPQGAISFEEREAAAYDESEVGRAKAQRAAAAPAAPAVPPHVPMVPIAGEAVPTPFPPGSPAVPAVSQLAQWPCQIRLAPVQAPYFAGCDLLVAADCTAYACADFHVRFMEGRVTLVGCPKLDGVDYAEKLGAILAANDVRSVLLARMDVPCCGGLQRAVAAAVESCGRGVSWKAVTLDRAGHSIG